MSNDQTTNNNQPVAPTEGQVIQGLLNAAGIKETNEATLEAARKTLGELQQYNGKPELMMQKAKSVGLNVDDYLTNQATLQAESARLDTDLAGLAKERDVLAEKMDKGLHRAGIIGGVAGIIGGILSYIKLVKPKSLKNKKLSGTGIVVGIGVVTMFAIGLLTSLFTYNPNKTKAVELEEKATAPLKESEKINQKMEVTAQSFHQEFAVALLKHNIQNYALEKKAEAAEIKSMSNADAEKKINEGNGITGNAGNEVKTHKTAADGIRDTVKAVKDTVKEIPKTMGFHTEKATEATDKKQKALLEPFSMQI